MVLLRPLVESLPSNTFHHCPAAFSHSLLLAQCALTVPALLPSQASTLNGRALLSSCPIIFHQIIFCILSHIHPTHPRRQGSGKGHPCLNAGSSSLLAGRSSAGFLHVKPNMSANKCSLLQDFEGRLLADHAANECWLALLVPPRLRCAPPPPHCLALTAGHIPAPTDRSRSWGMDGCIVVFATARSCT